MIKPSIIKLSIWQWHDSTADPNEIYSHFYLLKSNVFISMEKMLVFTVLNVKLSASAVLQRAVDVNIRYSLNEIRTLYKETCCIEYLYKMVIAKNLVVNHIKMQEMQPDAYILV